MNEGEGMELGTGHNMREGAEVETRQPLSHEDVESLLAARRKLLEDAMEKDATNIALKYNELVLNPHRDMPSYFSDAELQTLKGISPQGGAIDWENSSQRAQVLDFAKRGFTPGQSVDGVIMSRYPSSLAALDRWNNEVRMQAATAEEANEIIDNANKG